MKLTYYYSTNEVFKEIAFVMNAAAIEVGIGIGMQLDIDTDKLAVLDFVHMSTKYSWYPSIQNNSRNL